MKFSMCICLKLQHVRVTGLQSLQSGNIHTVHVVDVALYFESVRLLTVAPRQSSGQPYALRNQVLNTGRAPCVPQRPWRGGGGARAGRGPSSAAQRALLDLAGFAALKRRWVCLSIYLSHTLFIFLYLSSIVFVIYLLYTYLLYIYYYY